MARKKKLGVEGRTSQSGRSFGTLEVFFLKYGGREGIRTPGLLIANSGENKLRQGATIT